MKKTNLFQAIALGLLFSGMGAGAGVAASPPGVLNHQGIVKVDGAPFSGEGYFKFALVDGAGTTTYWSNDGTSADALEPASAVPLTVSDGRYSVALGDTSLVNMTTEIPASVFADQADVRLRIWLDADGKGSQLLSPDQRLGSVGYALSATSAVTVSDGAITSAKIAGGAIGAAQITPGTVLPAQTIAGASQAAVANTSYLATSDSLTTIGLTDTTANVGDVVQVTGVGAGGWTASLYQPDVWTARENNRSWFSVASSADGSKLVAGVLGGQIFTSTDSGVSWTARDSDRSWASVASSADGSKLVAVDLGPLDDSGGQIYTSTDSGLSWTPRESNRQWSSVASSADGNTLVAGVAGGFIYTSTDSGETWTPRMTDTSRAWRSMASSADGSKLVAVGFNSQIYTSTDSGVNWTARESIREWSSVASSADGSKLVAADYTGSGEGGRIYTSTDSGLSWTARENDREWFSVASSANGNQLVAVATGGQVYTSTDSGVSWTPRESTRNWRSVASSADGNKLVAAAGGEKIYTSGTVASGAQGTTATLQYLGNGQWTALGAAHETITSTQLAPHAVQNAHITPGTVLPAQTIAGVSQTAVANTGYLATSASLTEIDLTDTTANVGDIVQVTGAGVGGWRASRYQPDVWTARESNRWWRSVASSADGSKLVAAVSGGQIYTSTDSGVSWTARENNRSWEPVASSADGSKLVAAVSVGQIYTSTDSGVSWTARENNRLWRSVASSADGSKLVAVGFNSQIYTSTDSGVSWTARENNREWESVASSADGSKLVAAVFRGQIYTSTDSGVSWTARESNREWESVASSADGNKLVAAVFGGQIYTSGTVASGAQGTTATLQYLGNAQWTALGAAHGTVTWAQLADGGVTSAKLSDGAALAEILDDDGVGSGLDADRLDGLSSESFWKLGGNTATTPGTHYLGTADNQAIEFKVNGQRALRIEPKSNSGNLEPNLIGGSSANSAAGAANGAVISGGGGASLPNQVLGSFGVVSGGRNNTASSYGAVVGGGGSNTAGATDSTVSGGFGNTASAQYSTVGGGYQNTASGNQSVVPGGSFNVAQGSSSLAAGNRAKALHNNAFVWADSQAADFSSTANNQFLIRASGGVGIGTNNPDSRLQVVAASGTSGNAISGINQANTTSGVYGQNDAGGFGVAGRAGGSGVGVYGHNPGGAGLAGRFDGNIRVNGSAAKTVGGLFWEDVSDARLKEVGQPFTLGLAAVDQLQPKHFRYAEGNALGLPSDVDRIGLIAQELQAVIPEAVMEKTSGYLHVNAEAVLWTMLNAITDLHAHGRQLETKNAQLKAEHETLKTRLEKLEQRLEQKLNGGAE